LKFEEYNEFYRIAVKNKRRNEKGTFEASTDLIQTLVFSLSKKELIPLITEIGAIPKDIKPDSSEEKLYTKVSDIVLAKCFHELGLNATVNKERANCADILAKSVFHNYSLVGDAKSFRLSRTAKNAKDFKVKSMADWKGDNDYSILVCPYYQYPKSKSQIYGQALNDNVALFSWEHLAILLENTIPENAEVNLSNLWNLCFTLSENINIADRNNCFLDKQNEMLRLYLKLDKDTFNTYFKKYRSNIIARGETEIQYWEDKVHEITLYTRKQAIEALLSSLKLQEKITSIKK
jgi:type II restriction enzyme